MAGVLEGFPLSPKQVRSIVESRSARISLWEGSVRSGKSVASMVSFLIGIAEAPPSGLIIIIGRTLQTAERNIIEPLQDPALFGEVAAHVHHTRGASTATILGRTVHIMGAADARAEGKLRGLTAYLILIDEATLIAEEMVSQALARLSVPNARMLMTTNPGSPRHWLRQKYLLRASEINMATWHFTLDDNPFLDKAYVDSLKSEMTGVFYKRNIEGLWVTAEGAVYDMWDEDTHVVDDLPLIVRWPSVGVDYGTTNPFAALLLGLGEDGVLYLATEYRWDSRAELAQKTDNEYSEAVTHWLDGYTAPGTDHPGVIPEKWVVDPSAASFILQLWRDGMSPTRADNSVLDGIRCVSSLLNRGLLKVHRSCTGLIEEIGGYAWDEKAAEKGEDKPIKVSDHSCDAARYAIYTTEYMWRHQLRSNIIDEEAA